MAVPGPDAESLDPIAGDDIAELDIPEPDIAELDIPDDVAMEVVAAELLAAGVLPDPHAARVMATATPPTSVRARLINISAPEVKCAPETRRRQRSALDVVRGPARSVRQYCYAVTVT